MEVYKRKCVMRGKESSTSEKKKFVNSVKTINLKESKTKRPYLKRKKAQTFYGKLMS